nr:hypothetical protein Iba_chr13aCG7640 [Ipomoea batatas]
MLIGTGYSTQRLLADDLRTFLSFGTDDDLIRPVDLVVRQNSVLQYKPPRPPSLAVVHPLVQNPRNAITDYLVDLHLLLSLVLLAIHTAEQYNNIGTDIDEARRQQTGAGDQNWQKKFPAITTHTDERSICGRKATYASPPSISCSLYYNRARMDADQLVPANQAQPALTSETLVDADQPAPTSEALVDVDQPANQALRATPTSEAFVNANQPTPVY